MNSKILFVTFLFFSSILSAQQPFTVPEISNEQKQEILYNHVIAYAATGIGFAKTKGASPEEFGKYIGTQFKPFWNPEHGFLAFANGMLFILGGMHPDNDLQIIEQNEKMIRFRLKNVDFFFKSGNAFGISYNEFLACSKGIISTLSEHMNVNFSHKTDGIWYEVMLSQK